MRNIKNLKELESELAMLQSRKAMLENEMRLSVDSIREGMKPLRVAGRILGSFIRKDASHDDLLARSLGFTVSKLGQRFLFSKASSPVRTMLSFFLENITVNLAASKTTPIAAMLSGFVKDLFNNKRSEEQNLSPESRVTLP